MTIKLFNELYCSYFSTVYHILKESANKELTDIEYRRLVKRMSDSYGFPETTDFVVQAAIDAGKNEDIEGDKDAWPFFDRNKNDNEEYINRNRLNGITSIPLSKLEKMWLKSIYSDPRVRLFIEEDTEPTELRDVEPLFDWNDLVLFDQYRDGDPFEEKQYIEMFRRILKGVRNQARLEIKFRKPNNGISFNSDGSYEIAPSRGIGTLYIDPDYIEYSERDNRFRLIGNNPRFGRNMVNIASVEDCKEVEPIDVPDAEFKDGYSKDSFRREAVFELVDENNALERFLLNFSHYDKEAEYIEKGKQYRIKLTYDDTDETDLVIRTLSFGPRVKAVEPKRFVELIRERLWQQTDIYGKKRKRYNESDGGK